MIRLMFEPAADFTVPQQSEYDREAAKDAIVRHLRMTRFSGREREVEFELNSGGEEDILVREMDPEEALGLKVFGSAEDYYDDLEREMVGSQLLEDARG